MVFHSSNPMIRAGAALGLLLTTVAAAAEPAAVGIDGARTTVAKWLSTQQLIFQERKDWQDAKEILVARIAAAEREITALQAKVDESDGKLNELSHSSSLAVSTEAKLADSSRHMATAVTQLETDVVRLCKMLPAGVLEKVTPLRQRIPADPATTRASVAERMQNVLGILNMINEANGQISLVTEVRPLSDGKPSEVKTVYVGLGQAYFLSASGEAGIGRPTPDGWTWTAANDIAPRVAQTIEILENKAKPGFVPLPVTIH